MIGGATRGKGGWYLGAHLADRKRQNDTTFPGLSRGLVTSGIQKQVKELTDIVSHSGHSKPIYHAHADPATEWNETQWAEYWRDYEKEFHLERQPFMEAVHVKHGREHRHRVYSLVLPNGSCIRMDHDHVRREKLHRLAEIRCGEPLVKGKHNRAVVQALVAEGRQHEADIITRAGLTDGPPAVATLNPPERAQQERTKVPKATIGRIAYDCWMEARNLNADSFQDILSAWGLSLCKGYKVPVLMDSTGNCHPLLRAINAGAKEGGHPLKLRKNELDGFLSSLSLRSHAEIRKNINDDNGLMSINPREDDGTHGFNLKGFDDDTEKENGKPDLSVPREADRVEPEDVNQHLRNSGPGAETRTRRKRPDSGNQGSVAGNGRTSENGKQDARKAVAEARLRFRLQEAHIWGYAEELRLEYRIARIRVIDRAYLKRIRQEVDREQPDTDFLQRAYRDLSVFYVERYPKPWTPQNTDQTMERILELALMIINALCQFLFGCSFAVGIQNYDDDLAKDVKAREMARGHNFESDLPISAKKMRLG